MISMDLQDFSQPSRCCWWVRRCIAYAGIADHLCLCLCVSCRHVNTKQMKMGPQNNMGEHNFTDCLARIFVVSSRTCPAHRLWLSCNITPCQRLQQCCMPPKLPKPLRSHCDRAMPSNKLSKVLNLWLPAHSCTAELLIQYATSDADNYMGYGQLRGALSLDLLSGKATEVKTDSDDPHSMHTSENHQGCKDGMCTSRMKIFQDVHHHPTGHYAVRCQRIPHAAHLLSTFAPCR